MNYVEKKELERQKVELERKLKYLRKKLDKPVTTIGVKPLGKIVLYRNRVENKEYSFKLDEGVTIDYGQNRNFMLGKVYYVLDIYCKGKCMSSPLAGTSGIGAVACHFFKKMFLKTQDEYIRHKDIIDREYAGFDKLEAELREIKDKLEEDEITSASNERLKKIEKLFGDIDGGGQ